MPTGGWLTVTSSHVGEHVLHELPVFRLGLVTKFSTKNMFIGIGTYLVKGICIHYIT